MLQMLPEQRFSWPVKIGAKGLHVQGRKQKSCPYSPFMLRRVLRLTGPLEVSIRARSSTLLKLLPHRQRSCIFPGSLWTAYCKRERGLTSLDAFIGREEISWGD